MLILGRGNLPAAALDCNGLAEPINRDEGVASTRLRHNKKKNSRQDAKLAKDSIGHDYCFFIGVLCALAREHLLL